jgi:hypothetical protein
VCNSERTYIALGLASRTDWGGQAGGFFSYAFLAWRHPMIHHFPSYNFLSITCMIMNDLIGIHHHIYTTTESEHTFTCGSNLQYMFFPPNFLGGGRGWGRPSEFFCLLYIPISRYPFFFVSLGISLRGVVLFFFANMGIHSGISFLGG